MRSMFPVSAYLYLDKGMQFDMGHTWGAIISYETIVTVAFGA